MKHKELKQIKKELNRINERILDMRMNPSFGFSQRIELSSIESKIDSVDKTCEALMVLGIIIAFLILVFGLAILYCIS